ncbi:MAG TPA: tetratricopeptide repeat protein [Thermoanaerobaculia bacterium]|nr:tetratricopeptide repeat protein [Thermoanaerobaculia bacterium]
MPSRLRTILLLIAVLATAVVLPLSAQDWKGRGRVQGIVTNTEGKPVAGAAVTVRRAGKNDGPEGTKTDDKGRWAVAGLATGNWEITIEASGYNTAAGATKVIEGGFGQAETLRIELRPAVAQAPSQDAVKASASATAITQGNAFLTQGKFPEARAEYQKALAEIEETEKKAPVMFGIAQTYAAEGKKAEAVKTLEESLVFKPGDEKTLRLLVDILVAEGREADAQKYLAQLPQGATVAPDTLLNIGIKKYNEGDMAGAQAQFDRVVKENPELPDAYYFRGLTLLAQGKTAEAKADFLKLLEIAPTHDKAAEVKDFLKDL